MIRFWKTKKSDEEWETDVVALRGWLPKRLARESAFNRHFFLIWVALVFTVMFAASSIGAEENAYAWMYEIGVVLASAFFGFCLSNWWSAWDKGDDDRANAEKIDDKLEEEIQWISENLKQIANSVSLLKKPEEGFLDATRFMLTAQLTAVGGRIERMALDIDRLGYNSGAFLEEKKRRFTEIHARVRDLMRLVPSESGLEGMDRAVMSLIDGMGGPAALSDHSESDGGLSLVETVDVDKEKPDREQPESEVERGS